MKSNLIKIIGGVLVLFFFISYFSTPEPKADISKNPKFLVVLRDMQPGSFIETDDIGWREYNQKNAMDISRYFSEKSVKNSDIVGAVVRSKLKRNDFISISDVRKPGQRGFLSSVLRVGKRAVSVPVDDVTGISNLISLGDTVDVILTLGKTDDFDLMKRKQNDMSLENNRGDDMSNKFQKFAGKVLAENLRVIAVDKKIESLAAEKVNAKSALFSDESNEKKAWVVTLEALPAQASLLAVSRHMGTLSLSLRNPNDTKSIKQKIIKASELAPELVHTGPVMMRGDAKMRYINEQKDREKRGQLDKSYDNDTTALEQ